jgi:glycosidase
LQQEHFAVQSRLSRYPSILVACLSLSLALGSGCEENDPIAYVDADISTGDGGVDGPVGDGIPPKPDGVLDPDTGPKPDGTLPDPDGPILPDDTGPKPDGPNPTCNNTCDVTFELADGGETDVILMGEFDDWSSGVTMTKSGGKWTAKVSGLRHGQLVQYKFAKNGKTQWVTDPAGKTCKEIGTNQNSYLQVDCPNPCAITTSDDWRDGVLYFVMLDRFQNGDKTNDDPVKDRFGQPVRPISDWNGGDLQGLIDKIKDGYFTRLGVNILWISNPIMAADGAWDGWGDSGTKDEIYTGYHGYWPTDMNKVEPRLGTRLLLKQMIQEAHAKGIKVIMDYPMNHVHSDSPHYKNNKSWFWGLPFSGQDCICGSAVCGWESAQKERCWFDPFLPDFNYTNAAAMKFSLDNLVSWAKDVGGDGSNVGFDGFRMDAVKHIDISWVTSMRKRLETEFPGKWLWTVGETFTGDKALIKAYVGPDKLDGQFDFPLHDEIRSKLVQRQGTMKNLGDFLQDNRCPYGGKSLMSTFLGNHDKQRVIHDGENKFYNRFSFPTQPTAAEPYERLAMGFTLLMTLPGVPLIYYGDEVGLAGGQDPDNRRMMPFNGKTYAQAGNDDAKTLNVSAAQEQLFKHIAKLTQIRHANPALRRAYPEVDWTATTDQVLVYTMAFSGAKIIVAINRSDSTQNNISVGGGSYTDLLTNTSVSGSGFSLSPRSAKILK